MSKSIFSTTSNPDDYKPTYGDPKVTAANDVALEKGERHGAKQGVSDGPNKEVGGQSYPGRALPKTSGVETAKDNPGTATRCAKIQTGDNRYPINQHEEKHKTHGPNN